MKQIVFLGSKPIGAQCLSYLVQNQQALNFEIVAVRTQSRTEFATDQTVASIAMEYNIPLLSSLDDLPSCDIIYSVQHHEILKSQHIKQARQIAVNLHLAPLPEYRGCNQFSFAIMDEALAFGVSIHQIDEKIDHGFLLFEARFPIAKDIWVADLYDLAVKHGLALFQNTLAAILKKEYPLIDTKKLGRSSSLHFRKEIQALKMIDLSAPLSTISKTIRATSMPGFEMPYTIIDGEKYYLINEKYIPK